MLFAFLQQPPTITPFNDLATVEENQHGAEHGECHALRQIRQKGLCALVILAVRHIILDGFVKVIIDLAGNSQLV